MGVMVGCLVEVCAVIEVEGVYKLVYKGRATLKGGGGDEGAYERRCCLLCPRLSSRFWWHVTLSGLLIL